MGVTGYEVEAYRNIARSAVALERLAAAVERMAPPVPDRLAEQQALQLVQEVAAWTTRDDDPTVDLIIRARKILESP